MRFGRGYGPGVDRLRDYDNDYNDFKDVSVK